MTFLIDFCDFLWLSIKPVRFLWLISFTYKAIINFCCCDYVKKCIFSLSMINGGRVCYYFLQISYSLFFTISRCSCNPWVRTIQKKKFGIKKVNTYYMIIFGPKMCTKFSISYNYCTIYSRAGQVGQANGKCFGQEIVPLGLHW